MWAPSWVSHSQLKALPLHPASLKTKALEHDFGRLSHMPIIQDGWNKWQGWYVSRCHVSWRCCWSTFNSAAEENKWEGKGSHLSNYKQISTALVMLGRLNRVCTGPGHLICKIRLMYVCEALHIYWATCFEIMTLGDLGSENTNWLPAAQQANRHVTAMALGCWFQMLFLSVARAGGSSSTSFPGMIKAGWYGRGTAIWRCSRFAVRCVKHVKLCPLFVLSVQI